MNLIETNENEATVEMEEGEEFLWVKTPRGEIMIYVGEDYSSITSFVRDTEFAGFYSKGTKKTTSRSGIKGANAHVSLRTKEE